MKVSINKPSQWFLNILSNKAKGANLAALGWFNRRFKNHILCAFWGSLGSKGFILPFNGIRRYKTFSCQYVSCAVWTGARSPHNGRSVAIMYWICPTHSRSVTLSKSHNEIWCQCLMTAEAILIKMDSRVTSDGWGYTTQTGPTNVIIPIKSYWNHWKKSLRGISTNFHCFVNVINRFKNHWHRIITTRRVKY